MHWTYTEYRADDDLEQGDILAPTPELTAILREVHPHFCSSKYFGFTVSTQSCDLVQRPQVKARYITISAVRSLRAVLPRLLAQQAEPVADGVFRASDKIRAREFLSRVLNQNEQAQGLFYLHADAGVGLGESCVTLLRVSVALRMEHYAALVRARRGRLTPEFRAKYGWLLGNLYSRTATPDWQDFAGSDEFKNLVTTILESPAPQRPLIWIEDDLVEAGLKAGIQFSDREESGLLVELEPLKPRPPIERLTDEVVKQANQIFQDLDVPDRVLKLRQRLMNNGVLRKLVKRA